MRNGIFKLKEKGIMNTHKVVLLILMFILSNIVNAAVTTFTVTQDTANPVPSGSSAVYSLNIATTSAYTDVTAEVIFPAEFKTITPAVVSQIPGTTSTVTTLADGRIKVTYKFPLIPAGTSAILKISGLLRKAILADKLSINIGGTLYDNTSTILAEAPVIKTIIESTPSIDFFYKEALDGQVIQDIRSDRSKPVTYSVDALNYGTVGSRILGKIIVTDTLPAGGVYVAGSTKFTTDPPSCFTYGEPTYNTTSNTLTWEITNLCTNREGGLSLNIKFDVLYPTANNGDVVVNNVSVIAYPDQAAIDASNSATNFTSVTNTLVLGMPIIPSGITGKNTAMSSIGVTYLKTRMLPYSISNTNKTENKYEYHQVTDEAPAGTEVLGFSLYDYNVASARNTTPLTVEYKNSSGNWVTFATYPFNTSFNSTNVTFATLGITGVKGLRFTTAIDPIDSSGKAISFSET